MSTPKGLIPAWRTVLIGALLLGAALMLLRAWFIQDNNTSVGMPTHLALVVPDGMPQDDVHLSAWRDAASETGFALTVVAASQLLQPGSVPSEAALILPDSFHRQMNAMLIANVTDRVRRGARLMLIYDAGLVDMAGHYSAAGSRLSELAGVTYALYGEQGVGMQNEPVVHLEPGAMEALALPPGKVVHHASGQIYSARRTPPREAGDLSLATYFYGRVRYPVFNTQGPFDGERLLYGEDQELIAGRHLVGLGEVLFVNLPLTFLKLRTDGLLLHSFLRYFAQDMAQLPQLSPMPNAQGALIMNWHVDSGAAVPALEALEAMGAFEQGPYSTHLTAGPDVNVTGDGAGMDLPQNAQMRLWVQRFAQRGDEVGSHGGWIHNEFGRMVDQWPRERSTQLIDMNVAAIGDASGRPVREYSAPVGNHPLWVTQWLSERGISAYYFTGDIGMPPTRSYQNEARGPASAWAFPVMSFGPYAAFEEAKAKNVPQDEVAQWLIDVADFCSQQRTVRLVYAHPPGVLAYPEAFKRWLQHTDTRTKGGSLRWMTMAQYAAFANQRQAAQWAISTTGRSAGKPVASAVLRASHDTDLTGMSWLLPSARFAEPQIKEGEATVALDGRYWRVTASRGKQLSADLPLLAALAPPVAHAVPAASAQASSLPASAPSKALP
jgi:hypothetical protein